MMRRTRLAALALAGWTSLALLTFGPADATPDYGIADEPVALIDGTTVVVPCDLAADDVDWGRGTTATLDALIARCDHRVTREPCEEDQVCALAQINATAEYQR